MLLSSFARSAFVLAAVALLASQPVSAQANRVESPSRFSGSHTTIDFEGLTGSELVAEQYAALGVHFSLVDGGAPFADFTNPANEFRSVADGTGLIQNFEPGTPVLGGMEDFPDMVVTFDSPMNRVGFAVVSNMNDDILISVSCMCLGEVVATEFFDTTFGWRFIGLETEVPFDQILVNAELVTNAAFRLDDLSFENDPTVVVIDSIIPDVTITSPADGALLCVTSVFLAAEVFDQGATTVTSIPAGITAALPAGGGSVSGTVSLSEGQNTLIVSAVDPAGNRGGTSVTVFVDTTAPTVIVTPAEGAVVPPSPIQPPDPVRVLVQVTDASATTVSVAGVSYSVPAGGGSVSAPVDLVEGANAITISVVDACGNETQLVRTIVLDSNAPLMSIDQPLAGSCFGPDEESVPVQVTLNDLTQVTVYSVPAGLGGMVPAGGGLLTGAVLVPEGTSVITVFATDEAGNQSQASVSVSLDTTPPVAAVVTPVAGDAIRGIIDFDGQASDGADGSGLVRVDLLVDGAVVATFAAGTPSHAFDTAALADGLHTFSILAVDGKGLATTSSNQALVDNTPPTVQMDNVVDGEVVNGSLSFQVTASDDTSGVMNLRMTVDGGPPSPFNGSVAMGNGQPTVTATSIEDTTTHLDGSLLLTAVARDEAGNSAVVHITVQVDNTAPGKTLISPTHGEVISGVVEIVADSTASDLATLEILVGRLSLGSSTSSPISVPFDTLTVLDGALTVTVIATDLVGNRSTCSAEVTVDNMDVVVGPRNLNLGSSGMDRSITALIEGLNVDLLIPAEAHFITLRVPGGSPVIATVGFVGGNVLGDANNDGLPDVTVKFDRQQVINNLRAGIAAGAFASGDVVPVGIVVDGRTIGEDSIRIRGE